MLIFFPETTKHYKCHYFFVKSLVVELSTGKKLDALSGLNFINIINSSFYVSSLTPILLALGAEHVYFLAKRTSKVGLIIVGETEQL